ncbi:MAG: hypothetical protein P4M11_04825 [Candidatus Pacebacteria bacterium]|nr:hypothetical protein [Candidatus Paceibacterota bacterium]
MVSSSSYYLQVTPVIFAVPVVLFALCVILAFNSRLKHKPYRTSNYMYAGYYVLGYGLVLLERVLVMPWLMLVVQTFVCGKRTKNLAGEFVDTTFSGCWGATHIVYATYACLAATIYAVMVAVSCALYCLDFFNSPLPWVDEPALIRVLALTQKITIAAALVFDPKVISHAPTHHFRWRAARSSY